MVLNLYVPYSYMCGGSCFCLIIRQLLAPSAQLEYVWKWCVIWIRLDWRKCKLSYRIHIEDWGKMSYWLLCMLNEALTNSPGKFTHISTDAICWFCFIWLHGSSQQPEMWEITNYHCYLEILEQKKILDFHIRYTYLGGIHLSNIGRGHKTTAPNIFIFLHHFKRW